MDSQGEKRQTEGGQYGVEVEVRWLPSLGNFSVAYIQSEGEVHVRREQGPRDVQIH